MHYIIHCVQQTELLFSFSFSHSNLIHRVLDLSRDSCPIYLQRRLVAFMKETSCNIENVYLWRKYYTEIITLYQILWKWCYVNEWTFQCRLSQCLRGCDTIMVQKLWLIWLYGKHYIKALYKKDDISIIEFDKLKETICL